MVAERHRIGGKSGPEVHPSWGVAVRVDHAAVPQCSRTIVSPAHEGAVGKNPTRLCVAGGHLVVGVSQRRGVRQGDRKHAAKRANAADHALLFDVLIVGKVASHVDVGRPIVRANAIATRRPTDDAKRSVHVVGRVGHAFAVDAHVEVAPRRGAAVITADVKAPAFAAVGRDRRTDVAACRLKQNEFNVPVWIEQEPDFITVKHVVAGPLTHALARVVPKGGWLC